MVQRWLFGQYLGKKIKMDYLFIIYSNDGILIPFCILYKNHLDVVLYIHTITSDWRQSSKSNWATKFETTPIYFYDMTTERDTFHYYYSPRKHKKGGGLIVSFLCIFYCASSVRFAGTAEVAIRMSGILSNFDFFPSL